MVLPFKRTEAESAATYTVYGKLPNRADFVRVNANHSVVTEFDDLIQQTFERLSVEENWKQAYDEGGPVEFQYVSRDLRHILIGVLKPSYDQAGRRYPLLAGAILPSESIAGYAPIAPIAYEVFFDGLQEQVSTAIDNSVEALSCRQFLESHLRVNDAAASDLDLAKSVVERFMNTTSIGRLDELLMAAPCSATLGQALLNIAFYRAFLRRFDNSATNQIILLPLPGDKGERALIACAWLSMLNALWQGRSSAEPWCGNYLLSRLSPEQEMLAACFGKAHQALTTIMLGGALDHSVILDLRTEQDTWRNHRLYAEVSYALGRLLADPALSLSGLCEFLQDVGNKLEDSI
jgi:type VI secretion system protein ImpM